MTSKVSAVGVVRYDEEGWPDRSIRDVDDDEDGDRLQRLSTLIRLAPIPEFFVIQNLSYDFFDASIH